MEKLLWLGAAGALGTLSRYGLASLVQRALGDAFPWGTLVVNMLGCFVFGLVWSLAIERQAIAPEVRTVVLVGFMGAFTTFSTFAFESGVMLREGQWLLLCLNLVGHNVLGLLCVLLGVALAR